MAIKILVDSASDINEKEAADLGLELLPMIVSFGEEQFYDGVDITPEEFFNRLIESDVLPTTSQINPYRFSEKLAELTADGSEVIVITLSSKLSGTYFSAVTAAEEFKNVYVVDSLNAALGERLLCQLALKMRAKGLASEEIVAQLNEKKQHIQFLAVLDTLEYLKKGGRISAGVALAGELMSIKPVISLTNGEVRLVGKALGSKRVNNLLTSLVEKTGGIDFSMPYGTIWSGLNNTLLKKYIQDSHRVWENDTTEVPMYSLGSVIGTHIGPGAIGVAFFGKE